MLVGVVSLADAPPSRVRRCDRQRLAKGSQPKIGARLFSNNENVSYSTYWFSMKHAGAVGKADAAPVKSI